MTLHAPEASLHRIHPHPLVARPGDTVGQVRGRLRQRTADQAWSLLCVVDGAGHLLGTLAPQQLAALDDATRVDDAMQRDGPRVAAGMDQEEMVSWALHHGVAALPVVDDAGHLLGVVGPSQMMRVLRREHVEDLHRLAGITREAESHGAGAADTNARAAVEALEAPPLRRARHRLPWLLVGLAGSVVATVVVARFEQTLAERPALAFFVPGLVYLADAIGTQTEAVAVRGLSLSRSPLARLAGGEFRTGLLIGVVLALLALPLVWLAFGDVRLALAVSGALASASMVASLLGLMLPWALQRLKLDPAYGSGPLATIVQDVLSLLIYFGFATALLF